MRDAAVARGAAIVCADPYLAFARLTQWWAARRGERRSPGCTRRRWSSPARTSTPRPAVGALAFVGQRCPHRRHRPWSAPSVTWVRAPRSASPPCSSRASLLSDGCRIGRRGIVHGGAVIGADGFGFAPTEGRWEKIEQLGGVVIGDDVEIGANTCIDRGALEDTVIEDGVKLDNLIQIGHNVRIGAHTALAGCMGVAGSARIGRHCTVGGAAIILGHLEIVDHVHITAATVDLALDPQAWAVQRRLPLR